MSEFWITRERKTNKLVRAMAEYVFSRKDVIPEQLYGLCQLTWITNSKDINSTAYIKSVKIPALGSIFQKNFDKNSIDKIGEELSAILSKDVSDLVISHTGFTNFYPAFRNSALKWIKDNFTTLLPIFLDAYNLSNKQDGLVLVEKIMSLPKIPKANNPNQTMRPELLLTPVFFSLDRRVLFPIINGNKGVDALLSKLKVKNASLKEKYQKMISLYGEYGINDAADLDQVGNHLLDIVEIDGVKPKKKRLENKPTNTNSELPLKDEDDIISILEARTRVSKKLHNKLTNNLREIFKNYSLFEGNYEKAKYDVLVSNYDNEKNDLIIEVKSSSESAHVRMAIGQVLDYWFTTYGNTEVHVAILLPEEPKKEIIDLLNWLEIGLIWFSDNKLETSTEWLKQFVKN